MPAIKLTTARSIYIKEKNVQYNSGSNRLRNSRQAFPMAIFTIKKRIE